MFKQLRKANQNDYLLITATLILLVVFSLSLLSYVQGQQKAAERDQAQALATGFSRTLKGEIKSALTLLTTLKELFLASDGKVDNFSTVAKDLLAENTAASNLQLAPKGKVTEIYPLKGNEAGKINLLTDPIRGPLCRYGISHQVTVSIDRLSTTTASYWAWSAGTGRMSLRLLAGTGMSAARSSKKAGT
ncbi:hypothetical protein [Lactobacillus delbrueckii]|uniref:hypothetical protein n=1 Tax=Lactobacillus delbrueckii TaxID=1584 RepID=UPI0007394FBE|nr:hypothetical protein [Lactobacillus delbrueckii]CUS17691.1 hypothetical protein CFL1_01873 [Lactobacillus delbrueckii subsp. bulgaricus]